MSKKTATNPAQDLKALQTKMKQVKAELDAQKLASARIIQRITESKAEIDRLKTLMQSLSTTELVVSEHAMLRYIERVMHIDMHELRERVVPTEVAESAKVLGAGTYPTETHSVVIKDGVAITIKVAAGEENTNEQA
jgi:hypothetical protein